MLSNEGFDRVRESKKVRRNLQSNSWDLRLILATGLVCIQESAIWEFCDRSRRFGRGWTLGTPSPHAVAPSLCPYAIKEVAIGSPDDGDRAPNAGAIYIATLSPTAHITSYNKYLNPLSERSRWFGTSVTNVGDLDGNGVPDIAVGVPGEDDFYYRYPSTPLHPLPLPSF